MKLKINHLRLKNDIERDNRHDIINLRRKKKYRIASVLKIWPEHKVVAIIYEALMHNVKLLITDDVMILNKDSIIEKEFGLKVQNAAKSQVSSI